jgi:putative ABC transport system permease protein
MKTNPSPKPPFIAEKILRTLLSFSEREGLVGDFEEIYHDILHENGKILAWFWYWKQILAYFPKFIFHSLFWSFFMFLNNLKIAWRNIQKHKSYSFINIAGMVIGLASFILIFALVRHELSFDQFHKNGKNIYRLSENINRSGQWQQLAMSSSPLGPAMVREFPEVTKSVRILPWFDGILRYENKKFNESIRFADPSFFEVFSFSLIKGDPKTVLKNKFTIVLSESTAKKYFGDEDPMGKTINYDNNYDLKVVGIFNDFPTNSHLQFDFLISLLIFSDPNSAGTSSEEDWIKLNFYTYLLLQNDVDIKSLEAKFPALIDKYIQKDASNDYKPFLESFTSIYLHSKSLYGTGISGDINYVRLFSAIGILILLMAAINVINLSTARYASRTKEVGIRKVCGCERSSLIKQFLSESVVLSFISFLPAIAIAGVCLPYFNSILQKNISINYTNDLLFSFSLILITVFVGLISGIYPAFFLSSFQPNEALKSQKIASSKTSFRKTLVIFQFIITISLIIGTSIIYQQLHFLKNKDLGFNKENVIYLPLKSKNMKSNIEVLKNEIKSNSNILNVTATSRIIGNVTGGWIAKTPEMKQGLEMSALFVDYDFVNTLGLKVIEGRSFSKERSTDQKTAFLLNKQAVEKFNLENPIGKPLEFSKNIKGNIIGILGDFNFKPLHYETEPLIVTLIPSQNWNRYLAVRIKSGHAQDVINDLTNIWNNFGSEQTFEYFFLDERLDLLYKNEERFGRLITYFSALAVIIGCLGLFGLSAFTVEKRTKEIGVRKVLGAPVSSIITLLSKEFLIWVLLANIIAWPTAWFAMNKWLQNFAFRIHFNLLTFFLAGFLALMIALLTVSYHALKASNTNPINSLKCE